jgi:hypothetical protein
MRDADDVMASAATSVFISVAWFDGIVESAQTVRSS